MASPAHEVTIIMHSAANPTELLIEWSTLEVGRIIGEGGFADINLGKLQSNSVTIQRFRAQILPADAEKEFLEDCRKHREYTFPNIVRLIGITKEPGHFAIVMEHLPEGSLYDLLHKPDIDLPWQKRWEMAIDIGSGLAYLHEQKMLHKDLTSLNVLLGENRLPKISGFGLARLKTHLEMIGKGKKSIRWRAPETFTHNYQYTEAADVYSFGMILWELASRALPYASESDENTVRSFITAGQCENVLPEWPSYTTQIHPCWETAAARPTAAQVKKALETMRPPKPWQFSYTEGHDFIQKNGYTLSSPGDKDTNRIMTWYRRDPVPGYKIKTMQVIHNPSLLNAFENRLKSLEARHHDPARFKPMEEGTDEDKSHSLRVNFFHHRLAAPYQDPEAPHVRIIPVWHGVDAAELESILSTGFINSFNQDGLYGNGIYAHGHAQFAFRDATKNFTRRNVVLLLSCFASYSAYYVTRNNWGQLKGKGNYKNYDAHMIPLHPAYPASSKEYDPMKHVTCLTGERFLDFQMVAFEPESLLPCAYVVLEPEPPRPIPIPIPTPITTPPEVTYFRGIDCFIHAQYTEALENFETAATKNYPAASLWLYRLYSGINGTEANPEKMEHWKQKAAERHSWFVDQAMVNKPDGMNNLGLCFYYGIGCEQNHAKATSIFSRAAYQGFPDAQNNLAFCYAEGAGVPKSKELAFYWYRFAVEQGHADAQYRMGMLITVMNIKPTDYTFKDCFTAAANQGHPCAQFSVGQCYEHGILPYQKNTETAITWYRKAAEQGHKEAKESLNHLLTEPDAKRQRIGT